jgi:hypothetical protein
MRKALSFLMAEAWSAQRGSLKSFATMLNTEKAVISILIKTKFPFLFFPEDNGEKDHLLRPASILIKRG